MPGRISGVKGWRAWRSLGRAVVLAAVVACLGMSTPPADPEIIATFRDATRLAVDPLGNIYVIDRGAGRLIRLSVDGRRIEIGGPGADVPEPSAVDPTNGLFVVVADRASGSLFQFSRDMAAIGPLGSGTVRAPLSTRDDAGERGVGSASGRRTSADDITVGREGDIFILDSRARHVVRLDPYYRMERVIGGFDDGNDALAEPVSLCLDDDGTLFVADNGPKEIVAFDMHGARTNSRPLTGEESIQALRCDPGARLVVRETMIDLVSETEIRQIVLDVPTDAELRDVARIGDDFLILTPRHLYRTSGPANLRTAAE